jgi:DNA polymerase III alpha subunit
MIYDKFGNVIYQAQDLIDLFYKGHLNLDDILVESSDDIEQFEKAAQLSLKKLSSEIYNISVEEFDQAMQSDWFIPEEYKNMDIEGFLVDVCPKEHYQRLIDELREFRERNMLPLLRALKYIVDTMRQHNIVWGVGRGSSVASYVLFLLGVHKIDSIKYNLDWQEFLR